MIPFLVIGMLLVLPIYMFIRNNRVFNERSGILQIISKLNSQDITQGKPWQWRYQVFDEVSYDMMVLKFWRPVKSFYTIDGENIIARR